MRGVAQMSTLLNKSYLVKVSTKGEGVKMPQILSTWFVHSPIRILLFSLNDMRIKIDGRYMEVAR